PARDCSGDAVVAPADSVAGNATAGRPRPRLALLVDAASRHRVLIAVAFLAAFPWFAPYAALAANILIFGLFAVGFNLIYGYAGMLSFGHAALFGLGAYGCGIAIAKFGWHWLAAIGLGIFAAAIAAALVGWFATRTRRLF